MKMGLDVKVISFDSNKGKTTQTINGVDVIRYQIKTHKARILSLMLPVANALKKHEHETDLYHVYNVHPLAGAGLYKIMGGKTPILANLDNYGGFCPVSTAMHGKCGTFCRYSCLRRHSSNILERFLALPYALVFPFLKLLSRRVDRYIAPSDYVRNEYVRYEFDPNRIIVVPHSINMDASFNNCKVTHETINILYVGRMSNEKGVDVLINAFHRVACVFPNVRLVLVGDGPMLNEYHLLTEQIGISDRVQFTGYLKYNEVEHYYRIADIFVHPARWHEPFNVTLIEALAHEIPIVVSDVGSLKQIVREAGIASTKGDVEDLANKLALLIEDQSKMIEMSKRCRDVVSEYSDDRILKNLVDIYNQMNS